MKYSIENIKTVAVCGAGTMGAGIAYLFSKAGYVTILFDISDEQLSRAEKHIRELVKYALEKNKISETEANKIIERIGYTTDTESVVADLIIEAIVEKFQPKADLLKKLIAVNSENTIIASNTSSIPITRIAAPLKNPERIAGMHFFNPAHIMKLVEIISGAATNENVSQTLFQIAEKLEKTPVYAKDAPGFIVNRVARHYYVESLKILEENIASLETIDELTESIGFKMGPFKLMDLIGVDTNFNVTTAMFESFHFDGKFRPSRLQQQKVLAGQLGKKTGQGFYNYT